MKLLDGVRSDALLSSDGAYRFTLSREWSEAPTVLWIMLNPSTADADVDDPTIRRCQDFARRWGYGGIVVANLFALRSTDPKALYSHPDPVGHDNDFHLARLLRSPDIGRAVAAWGEHGAYRNRGLIVRRLAEVASRPLHVLGLTKAGRPRHPLYVKGDTEPEVWS